MAEINASTATRQALYRLVKVLKAQVATEVALLNDTGNMIPLPLDVDYYVAGSEEEFSRILTANNAACFIYPLSPSVVEAPRTGDGTQRAKLHRTTFRVLYVFKFPAAYTNYQVEGRNVTHTELVFHLSDRIMGGALNVIYKHAVNLTDIHEVEILNQYADVVTLNNNDLTGRAVLEIDVLQDVVVPMPLYTIA